MKISLDPLSTFYLNNWYFLPKQLVFIAHLYIACLHKLYIRIAFCKQNQFSKMKIFFLPKKSHFSFGGTLRPLKAAKEIKETKEKL
jgi:hypothetical protein